MFKKIILIWMCFLLMVKISYSKQKNKFIDVGIVSFYGKTHHGKKTASGEKFNMNSYTAAHKFLKFGTYVKVTNLKNKKYIVVKITDRGPYAQKRILDLSESASKKIGNTGLVKCKIELIKNNGTFE